MLNIGEEQCSYSYIDWHCTWGHCAYSIQTQECAPLGCDMSVCSGCSKAEETCSAPTCEETCESWTNIDRSLIGTDSEVPFWPANPADPECDEITPEECSTSLNYRCNSNCKIEYDPSCGGCSSDADCTSAKPICNTATKECVKCLSDGDCGYDSFTHRKGLCRMPPLQNPYTCEYPACTYNSDCSDGFCCGSISAEGPGGVIEGQCVEISRRSPDNKLLCTS